MLSGRWPPLLLFVFSLYILSYIIQWMAQPPTAAAYFRLVTSNQNFFSLSLIAFVIQTHKDFFSLPEMQLHDDCVFPPFYIQSYITCLSLLLLNGRIFLLPQSEQFRTATQHKKNTFIVLIQKKHLYKCNCTVQLWFSVAVKRSPPHPLSPLLLCHLYKKISGGVFWVRASTNGGRASYI